MTTFARGLEGVVAAQTRLSFIDGERGILEYVGIPIGELAQKSTFEETVFLLWNGRLPKRSELDAFTAAIRQRYAIPRELERLLASFPRDAGPMHVMRTAISALALFDPEPDVIRIEHVRDRGLTILAAAPTIVASFDRLRRGRDLVRPDPDLPMAANFLYMLNGQRPTPTMARALDICLILHTEHGLNNSTFAARVIISTLSDVYSAITGAIGSLRGPLHGGANEGVMEMLNEIPSLEAVEPYILGKLARKERIMGFGHRVYKAYDPRARYLRDLAQQLAADTGNMPLYEKSRRIEEIMAREVAAKGIYPNVDFYSATTYHCIGLPLDLFTPMFVLSRIGGWVGHVVEQLEDNRLYRPAAQYVGPHDLPYVPIDQR